MNIVLSETEAFTIFGIICALMLIVNIILGFITKKMNAAKGIPGGYWWGFFLGITGVIVVALRPYNPEMYK